VVRPLDGALGELAAGPTGAGGFGNVNGSCDWRRAAEGARRGFPGREGWEVDLVTAKGELVLLAERIAASNGPSRSS
jgi:hypothetical protein